MNKTRDNHFVAQWYQKGFTEEKENQLCYLTKRNIIIKDRKPKVVISKKWHTPAQQLYKTDLYSTFFGNEVNDDIEQKLFGPIDDYGSKAVRAFLTDDHSQWHQSFQNLFIYLDAQKLRTPKGLDWIKSKYPKLSQLELMMEMQALRSMHCTLWAEGARELVSAEDSEVKFIISDHPITIYNYACDPKSKLCEYPSDPDIALKGSQTIFPLSKNRCLILTNLEYAKTPNKTNPLEQRTNATRIRQSLVNTIEFINHRKLTAKEVTTINYIIKSRSGSSIAAGKEEWLYPEQQITCDWPEIKDVLLPPQKDLFRFGGEVFARFDNGSTHYQDAFGRTTPQNEHLKKHANEAHIGRNDICGCGSGKKYKNCCRNVPIDFRTTWRELSIRERNLTFCNCIRGVLGLDKGKTWIDVRRELSDNQISEIYGHYSILWPRETDIYSLLPKPDGKFRGLYTGTLDIRTIGNHALPMTSIFDELLIESPITNPNTINPDFSPTNHPEKYKYQALKEFLFMLEIEPFIGLNLVNITPSPTEFDQDLMNGMMTNAKSRTEAHKKHRICDQDYKTHYLLSAEDLINSIGIAPKETKINTLIHQLGLPKETATKLISEISHRENSLPLTILQKLDYEKGGQFIQFKIGPNYEIALFLAQATGSILVTDSESRWQELITAQHLNQGFSNHPWDTILSKITSIPIDYKVLTTLQKSEHEFSEIRNLLRSIDRMILDNERAPYKLTSMSDRAEKLMSKPEKPTKKITLKILSPDGGFYDANVQRLLLRSSCLKYNHTVRSIYGIALQPKASG